MSYLNTRRRMGWVSVVVCILVIVANAGFWFVADNSEHKARGSETELPLRNKYFPLTTQSTLLQQSQLRFESNRGQFQGKAEFIARNGKFTLLFEPGQIIVLAAGEKPGAIHPRSPSQPIFHHQQAPFSRCGEGRPMPAP